MVVHVLPAGRARLTSEPLFFWPLWAAFAAEGALSPLAGCLGSKDVPSVAAWFPSTRNVSVH